MLVPREADLAVLILILVVLPLVTYILLGIWGETSKRKARISMLAQLAAEEALRVDEAPPVVFTPHFMPHFTLNVPRSKISSYECAKCFAPATTRCSKCKSVRYCSGKCQIMHWRQGHKQECHQLAIMRSLSTSADSIQSRDHVENSKQVLQNVIDEPRNSDFLSDLSSDGSLATSNIAYDTASEKRLSSSEKRVSRKQRRETLTSNNLACALENAGTNDVDKPTLLGNKLGSGNFTSSVEVNDHAPTALTNVKHQHHKIMGEARTPHKPRFTRDNVENVVNECETSTNLISGGRFSSSNEALDLNSMAEDASISGSIVYKRPPYILGSTPSLSQKSAEKILCDESRVSASSACKSVQWLNSSGVSSSDGSNMSGSRKSSKVHKWDILGLMNDGSKNKMLFPYEDLVKFFQCEVWGISPRGLLNCGNSCYANAVLQCLTCTKPLMIYLLRRSHSKSCRIRDWCLMCELEEHASMLREGGGGPLSPSRVLSNMRNIGCRMGGGNQEDAHEFLRLLVMSMQSICLAGLGGEKEVDPKLQETTLIQQIFGGRLKSKVKCLRCHLESERYENIMDLTLEIHGWVESLEDALTQFTAPEDLDGENMYRCGRCAAYVIARKQLSVHEVPNILTIVLKRFRTGKYGKINKCVTFPDLLDMIPFVTGTADRPPLYMLYGVVVHLDTQNASFSGHYVSYVKDLQGTWFRIDDSEVQAVPLNEVMSEGAYMLFYSRSFPRPPRTYTEKISLHAAHKTEKTSRHGQQKQKVDGFVPESSGNGNLETFTDSVNIDYSDVTSSDWSLFTSSDESSFTTESRDSFSTVDHSDSSGLDPISSIFAPPFYVPEYPQSNSISCTQLSPCRAQTRFFSERRDFVVDSSSPTHHLGSVHRDRNSKEGSTRF